MAEQSRFRARWRGRRGDAGPHDLGACGWLESAPAAAPPHVLEGIEQADCAVLGAGFTGLAAARRLAELRPHWRIALVEAQRAGDGASGRSSGFLVDAASFIAARSDESAERFVRLSRFGIDALAKLVRERNLGCDWDDRGFVHAAASDEGARSLDALHRWLEARGVLFEDLDRRTLHARIGTSHYGRGILLPGSVLVQAGALVRGLAGSLPENVALFEHSHVRRIDPSHTLETVRGTLRTPRLIVALNAWMPRMGLLRDRLFPLLTYGSLTRRLGPEEQAALGAWPTWGILAQDPMGPSVRRTADQRLLVRSEAHYDPAIRSSTKRLANARERHRTALALRYPDLADVAFETTWAGAMGAVPSQTPFFGRLGPNVVGIAGFTGAGIAMGTTLGALAADWLCGEDHPVLSDALSLERPGWLPPEPFLSAGIRWRVARMNAGASG